MKTADQVVSEYIQGQLNATDSTLELQKLGLALYPPPRECRDTIQSLASQGFERAKAMLRDLRG